MGNHPGLPGPDYPSPPGSPHAAHAVRTDLQLGPRPPPQATNLANYHLYPVGPRGRLPGIPIPIRSAVYNPVAQTVILTTSRPINVHHHYGLVVTGLINSCGDPIDGDRNGVPGGPFVVTFGTESLAGAEQKRGRS